MKPSASTTESALRGFLIVVFGAAATAKLVNLKGLYQVLWVSLNIPYSLLWPLGDLVIACEILVVLALLFRGYRTYGLVLASFLSTAFFAFSAYRVWVDDKTPCHCFGDLVHISPLESCVLNVAIFASSLWLLKRGRGAVEVTKPGSQSTQLLNGVVGLGCCMGVAILISSQPKVAPLTQFYDTPEAVIGGTKEFTGEKAKYTVVMFGDYECAPCKHTVGELDTLSKAKPGLFRLAFRNLPLTQIHKYAMASAVAGEEGRRKGMFWPVHDALYALPVMSDEGIASVVRKFDLLKGEKEARKAVDADIDYALSRGLDTTPSLILIDDHGECWLAKNAQELEAHMN